MKFEKSTLRSAVEFGFKGCKTGHNLEKVLSDFDKLMKKYPEDKDSEWMRKGEVYGLCISFNFKLARFTH